MIIYQTVGVDLYNANRISPPSQTNIATTEHSGRVRVLFDWFTPPVGGVALTDDVIMGRALPAGSRIIGGCFACGAVGAASAEFTVSIDTEANVGTETPVLQMLNYSGDSMLVDAQNSGGLIPIDTVNSEPYQIKTPVEYTVWMTPTVNVWNSTGTISLAIYYVTD